MGIIQLNGCLGFQVLIGVITNPIYNWLGCFSEKKMSPASPNLHVIDEDEITWQLCPIAEPAEILERQNLLETEMERKHGLKARIRRFFSRVRLET